MNDLEPSSEPSAGLPVREIGLIAGTLFVAGLFAFRAIAPTALPWPDSSWNWLAMLSKLLLLGIGTGFAFRAARRFRGAGRIHRAWLGLGAGILAFLLGQLVLAYYQLLRGIDVPFPSPAEAFFLAAYPFLIASQLAFVRATREAGWRLGEPKKDRRRMLLVAGLALIVVLPTLQPILQTGSLLDRAINVAYPLLDIVLLAPAVIVLGVAFGLRGGRAQRVWLALVVAVVCCVLGDVLFAYLTNLELAALDPVVDLLYLLAYGAFALAPLSQLALTESRTA